MRLVFLAGSGVVTAMDLFLSDQCGSCGSLLRRESLLSKNLVSNRPRVDREPVVVKHLPKLRSAFGAEGQSHQAEHLCVAVLLDDVNALVMIDERFELFRERIGA